MKVCNTCKESKSFMDFGKNKASKDGLQGKCKTCSVDSMQQWKKANPEKYAEYNRIKSLKLRLKKHGIPVEHWEQILYLHGSKCAICRVELTTVFIDHDHNTGVVRGLLCGPCNSGLGFFKDSPERMKSAISYVLNPPLAGRNYKSTSHLRAEQLNGWKPGRSPRSPSEPREPKKYHCKCGAERTRQAKMCQACARNARYNVQWPDSTTLALEVSVLGYVGVGKKYGVSDNAVRKRLSRNGL